MVSLLIGSKGKQISSIMKSSKAEIVVNQPIHKMKHRTVKVEGMFFLTFKKIFRAVFNI